MLYCRYFNHAPLWRYIFDHFYVDEGLEIRSAGNSGNMQGFYAKQVFFLVLLMQYLYIVKQVAVYIFFLSKQVHVYYLIFSVFENHNLYQTNVRTQITTIKYVMK